MEWKANGLGFYNAVNKTGPICRQNVLWPEKHKLKVIVNLWATQDAWIYTMETFPHECLY